MPIFLKKFVIIITCLASFVLIISNNNIKAFTAPVTPTPTPAPAPTTPPTPTTPTTTKPNIGTVGGGRQNSTTKASSFSECDFSAVTSKADGSTKFIACIKGIITFIFVVSLFLVAIRIAVEAFASLNPFEKGKAVDNSAKLVSDIITGLLILGAPSIFLNFLNPQTLKIDIIQNISEGTKTIKTPDGTITVPGGQNAVIGSNGSLTVPAAGGDISTKAVLEAAKTDTIKSKAIADQIKVLADASGTIDGYNNLVKYLDAVKTNGGRPILDSILQTNNYQKSAIYTPNQAIVTLTGDATFVSPGTDFKELQLTFTTNPLNGIVVMPQNITLISNGTECSAPTPTIKAGTALGSSTCQYKVKGS